MTGTSRLHMAGMYDIPAHFKTIPKTFFQVGFIMKQLKVHDCRTGVLHSFGEFLELIPKLPEQERGILYQYLHKDGLL